VEEEEEEELVVVGFLSSLSLPQLKWRATRRSFD